MTVRTDVRQLSIDVGELLETHERAAGLEEFEVYADDPIRFMREELAWDPWEAQEEIADAVLDEQLVVVRSANGVGKDALAARLALWWSVCRGGLAILTGPTLRQVRTICFGEIRRAWSGTELPGELFEQELRVDRTTGAGIIGLTSTESGKLTGLHGALVLGIVTEGQAVEPHVLEALLSCAVGEDDRLLVLGNPLEPAGEFYRISQSGSGWRSIAIPASRHPNVITGETRIPGGITRAAVERIRSQYGADSGVYRARVEGEFPAESSEQLVPAEAIEAAFERFGKLDPPGGSPFILGIDPAGPGEDAFAVTVWRGRQAVEYHTWRRLEAPESADRIFDLMRDLRRGVVAKFTGATIGGLYVDEIGIGHGLVGILRRRCTGLEWGDVHVYGVNVAKKPTKKKRFVRRKDELIWQLREELVEGRVAFAPNAELAEEIRELRMRQTPDGRIETEPKDQMRARLGRSPDTLDSLLLGMSPWVSARKVLIA